MIAPWLRAAAVAIAVAGVVDPSWPRATPDARAVSVLASPGLPDAALADRVARALEERFAVTREPSFGPAATVVAGDSVPETGARQLGVVFAVRPEPVVPTITITDVVASAVAHPHARPAIDVRVRAQAAAGTTLGVSLRQHGITLDRAERSLSETEATIEVRLHWLPQAEGPVALTVEAGVEGQAAAVVDLRMTVTGGRTRVLHVDSRPSWMSTFVRRAIEADPRLGVTSRVTTSRGATMVAGQPPGTLADSLDAFDIVIAGAPDGLAAAEIRALDAWLRNRGGTAVLLLDDPASAGGLQSITGVARWREVVRDRAEGRPAASELLLPSAAPAWSEPAAPNGPSDAGVAAIWRMPVGRGRLVVSGALDAWRFRDRDDGAFDAFWREMVTRAASDLLTARMDDARAPLGPRRPSPDDRARIAAWAAATGGATIPESAIDSLADRVDAAIGAATEREPYHPMRSAWWMVPFGGALGLEWWVRRRRGTR